MLGLIYTLVVNMGGFVYALKEKHENEVSKTRNRNPNGLTYVDTKCRTRLLCNNELVYYTHKNGDYVLKNLRGDIYVNFSQIEREKALSERKKKAKENNETTYIIDDDDHTKDWYCKGKRFKDFKTGQIYVIRYIEGKFYYMDISNGMLVRKTDWQLGRDEELKAKGIKCEDKIDMEEFNKEQRSITSKRALYERLGCKHVFVCDYRK